jgi:hypothetical protein
VGFLLVLVGNALLGSSYYLQRSGFNDVFFNHLNLNTLHALSVYGLQFAAAVGYIVLGTAAGVWAARVAEARRLSWLWVLSLPLFLIFFAPLSQTVRHFASRSLPRHDPGTLDRLVPSSSPPELTAEAPQEDLGPTSAPPEATEELPQEDPVPPSPPPEPAEETPRKNLVFIYLEGLERAYFDVPGLMPHLSALRSRVLDFTNIHELVGGTIGGLVASQCGWPPFTDQALYREARFYPGLTCLGDLLKEQGYHSVYMGGASVRFTRKDTLFGTHGYAEVLGSEQLKERLPDPTYLNKWGLHDDSLFDIARDVFDDLADREGPFALVLLTLGTHVPGYLAASCPSFPDSEHVVVQAAHCTDKLVAEFVTYIRGSSVSDDTVIALMSDHLMWKGVEEQGLKPAPGSRRLTFMLDLPGEAGRAPDVRGSELDVAATLADVLDLSFGDRIGLGSSLLAGDGHLWTPESGLENLAAIRSFVRSNEVRAFMAEAREQPDDDASKP